MARNHCTRNALSITGGQRVLIAGNGQRVLIAGNNTEHNWWAENKVKVCQWTCQLRYAEAAGIKEIVKKHQRRDKCKKGGCGEGGFTEKK